MVQQLSQQPEGYQVSAVGDWEDTTSGTAEFYVDPARGVLLNIFTNKASYEDRIEAGGGRSRGVQGQVMNLRKSLKKHYYYILRKWSKRRHLYLMIKLM